MIIKLHKAGRSFKGVCRYLTHDAKAETAKRVAWTSTINLANDDVPSSVNEMLWTFRSADALKREAGVATGGSKLEKPVKHFSLSWPHGEAPGREHVVETVQAYMQHMGWADRQAVLVAHNDTKHSHVHVVMNTVSPVDGRAVRSSNDWRHSEAFALQYEREHGQVHCEQRLKPQEERHATPTRDSWQRFKKSEMAFDRTEVERLTKAPGYFERHDDALMNGREWEALKAYQRHQRELFFIDGKEAFRSVRTAVFREVREEFRGQWNAYYAAARSGNNKGTLAEMKLALTKAQNRALDERRERACQELREMRDQAYEATLEQQRFDRGELAVRQHQGLRTYQLMDMIHPAPEPTQPRRDKTRWQAGDASPAGRVAKQNEFDRSGQTIVHPSRQKDRHQSRPGVLQRGNDVAQPLQIDGFGRQLSEREQSLGRRTEETVKSVPVSRAPEVTDAASEKLHAAQAREMTDREAAKGRADEVAAMRASWNRRRRYRD
jgi:hypothetical protein